MVGLERRCWSWAPNHAIWFDRRSPTLQAFGRKEETVQQRWAGVPTERDIAEPTDAVDRAGITVFRSWLSTQPARNLSLAFGVYYRPRIMTDPRELNELETDLKQAWRYPAYRHIQGQLFHRTTCTGLRGILSCGEIRPNDGSFQFSFARSKTSYGFHHGYISLFDFQDTSVADQIRTFVIWNNLIGQVGKIFFLLVLDSSKLRTDLISSCSAPQPGQPNYGGCMRPIECWYPRPIRLDLVRDVIVVSHCGGQPEIVAQDASMIHEILDRRCS